MADMEIRDVEQAMPAQDEQVEGTSPKSSPSADEAQVGWLAMSHRGATSLGAAPTAAFVGRSWHAVGSGSTGSSLFLLRWTRLPQRCPPARGLHQADRAMQG